MHSSVVTIRQGLILRWEQRGRLPLPDAVLLVRSSLGDGRWGTCDRCWWGTAKHPDGQRVVRELSRTWQKKNEVFSVVSIQCSLSGWNKAGGVLVKWSSDALKTEWQGKANSLALKRINNTSSHMVRDDKSVIYHVSLENSSRELLNTKL